MRLEFYLLKIHFEQSDRQKLNLEQKKINKNRQNIENNFFSHPNNNDVFVYLQFEKCFKHRES